MTNFREKARSVKAAGVAERGNFTPTGAPKRMYNYWLERSDSRRAKEVRAGMTKENFCHFWRVVAFWGPARFLFDKAMNVLDNPITWGVMAAMFVVAVIIGAFNFSEFAFVLGIVGLIAVGVASLVSGIMAAIALYDHDNDDSRLSADLPPKKIAIAMAVFGFASFAVCSIIHFASLAWKKYDLDRFKSKMIIGAFAALAIAFGVIFFIDGGMSSLLTYVAALIIIPAVGLGLIFGFFALSDYISGLRAQAEIKRKNRPIEIPENTPVVVRKPKQPGKISKFFTGVADFIILITQVVRVNKWKICPLVEVDADKR